jgi:orotate phosphoribosyltransferase
MRPFNQEEYNKFLIENNVIGFFEEPITLKSGRISHWYVNCRNLLDRVGVMDKLVDFVLAFVDERNISVDYFFGVPEGATKLGVILNYKRGKSNNNDNQALIIGRGKPKEHGDPKDKYFIGPAQEGDKVIVVEDVTTTGGSLIDTIKHLQESNIAVIAAIGLVNRMEKRDDGRSVEKVINERNIPYLAMGNSIDLLPMARDASKPPDSVLEEVENYFDRYGIEPLKLRLSQSDGIK